MGLKMAAACAAGEGYIVTTRSRKCLVEAMEMRMKVVNAGAFVELGSTQTARGIVAGTKADWALWLPSLFRSNTTHVSIVD